MWHRPASASSRVEIVGDWDGWRRPGTTPDVAPDGWRVAWLDLPAGEHAYEIFEDGVRLLDRQVPTTAFHEGEEVSLAFAPDCEAPEVRVAGVEVSGSASPSGGRAVVRASFLAARDGEPLRQDRVSTRVLGPAAPLPEGAALRVVSADPATGALVFEATGLSRGKHRFAIEVEDGRGRRASTENVTVWMDDRGWEPRDAIIYQVVLDRFRGDAGPLAQPARPSDRAGGTLAGLLAALEAGEIEALGADTLWLSPLYANPEGDFPGNDGRTYTSYHGYWPIASRALDPRVATDEVLERFMSVAHARGLRVLFDVVPNHVHEQHPWVASHPERFQHDCLCGQPGCDWGEHIRTCAFAPYLPDLDWTRADVAREGTDDALWWIDRWGADGLRVDAVPMVPRAAVRRIAAVARTRFEHPQNPLYVLGENFTGPGGEASLRYDLGPFGLDGSFHFPLMWTLRAAIAEERGEMADIDATFRAGERAWEGAGAVMGLMIGNHDVSRFASVSAGNADGDAWQPAPQSLDPTVYAKQRLALAAVFTLPGAPVLYYGDEVGLAGRGDPDCRRVMPSEEELFEAQRETRAITRRLGKVRACSPSLRRGALRTVLKDAERLVYAREIEGDVAGAALVVLSRRPRLPASIALPPGAPAAFVDVLSGARFEARAPDPTSPGDAGAGAAVLSLPAAAFGAHVLLPEGDRCLEAAQTDVGAEKRGP